MIRSIFGRLLLSHIIVILLTTFSFGIFMSFLIREHVLENKRVELIAKGKAITAIIAPTMATGRLPYRLDMLGNLVGTDIWLVNQQGMVLAGDPPQRWTTALPDDPSQLDSLFNGSPQSWVRSSPNQSDPSITVALPLTAAPVPTALFLYTPITEIKQTIYSLDKLLFMSLSAGMLAAILLGFFIARSMTRPIADISRAATRFARGEYTYRIKATGQDEIGHLGQVFNSMAETLAHTEQNRRDFLANVSHELKTPVASIQALAEALADGLATKPEQIARYLSTIVEESKHIDRLIRDLLDLSQLEAGELSIIIEPVDLEAFLSGELPKYQLLAAAKNISLVPQIAGDLPPVLADSGRLSQIIANLLNNALRYSPESSQITIAVAAAPSQITLTVTDHGPGIDPGDQPFIWDRFYRVDKSRSRTAGGTGLGLAITKKLVLAMGGDIKVTSSINQGAAFSFTLPTTK
jgi:signal transduction histidine kinase